MKFELTQRLELECTVCGQFHRSETVEAKLFGYTNFAVCPCCGQEVPNHQDAEYQKRALLWINRKRKSPA